MPLALRLFTLALLLGWQVIASGVGLAHYCPKQATATSTCQCPHKEKKAEKASHDGQSWRKDCCDALERELPTPRDPPSSSASAHCSFESPSRTALKGRVRARAPVND